MNLQHASVATAKSTRLRDAGDMGLQGPFFLLARLLWLAISLLTLVVFCANLLAVGYGIVINILLVATTSVWLAISLVLFWHKTTLRAILLISLILVLMGSVYFAPIPRAFMNDGPACFPLISWNSWADFRSSLCIHFPMVALSPALSAGCYS